MEKLSGKRTVFGQFSGKPMAPKGQFFKKKNLSGLEQSRGAHNNVNFYSVFLSLNNCMYIIRSETYELYYIYE
nr:hypothetical protein [Proteiniborus ethanoligenes]